MHLYDIKPENNQNHNANPSLRIINTRSREAFYLGLPTTKKLAPASRLSFSTIKKLKSLGIHPQYKNYVGGVVNANLSYRYHFDLLSFCQQAENNCISFIDKNHALVQSAQKKIYFSDLSAGSSTHTTHNQKNLLLRSLGLMVLPKDFLRVLVYPERFCNQSLHYLGSMLLTMEHN